MRTALITGISGQDGAYLAQFLLRNGYLVLGSYRRTSTTNWWRLEELGCLNSSHLKLVELDLTDLSSVLRTLHHHEIDEVYNLAAQSFVGTSFDQPLSTGSINALGAHHILEAIRLVNRKIKFYQASTSEMFGKVQAIPQDESTSFYPRSPYGVAKLYAHWMTINYRESYGIFASSGILFNHESPLRGLEFVTRKITNGVAKIRLGLLDSLELGNLEAKRDWGYARDYIEGMWKMLQADEPDTFILSTGRTETVRNFVRLAFQAVDMEIEFEGSGINERAFDSTTGREVVRVNPAFFRPSEVDLLIGDPSKAKRKLNWESKTSLEELCRMMVQADLERNLEFTRLEKFNHKKDIGRSWDRPVLS